jgi:hypothetical protein
MNVKSFCFLKLKSGIEATHSTAKVILISEANAMEIDYHKNFYTVKYKLATFQKLYALAACKASFNLCFLKIFISFKKIQKCFFAVCFSCKFLLTLFLAN